MRPTDDHSLAKTLERGMEAEGVASPIGAVDINDPTVIATWCGRHGVTREQLVAAVGMVGAMPAALSFYLSSRGRPTKRITDEMRASRGPILPRDRRRKVPAAAQDEAICSLGEHDRIVQEKAMLESDLRVAADGLHAHPCPATIHAYDDAEKRLEDVCKREASLLAPSAHRHDATDAGVR